jgi:homoaconitate hydratase
LGTGLLEDGEVGISATNRNFKGRMGSRLAQAYLASPEVVVASAVAGRVMGPEALKQGHTTSRTRPELDYHEFEAPVRDSEEVAILPGFPTSLSGRLVFTPADNLNTDGIYSKDYTYKEGMTDAEMAQVVMQNYDPSFVKRTQEGDILVGGWNFGTGSSREQAATSLQAKGIALVLAGSFSQTYLRNAYNNGFVCIECPELVTRLKEEFRADVEGGTLTLIPGDILDVDFSRGTVSFRCETFRFPPLGSVPQGLVIAGGSENLIRRKLGLDN